MQKYYRDTLNQKDNPVLGLGSMLAGFTFEKSGETDEALRYYDEALAFTGFRTLGERGAPPRAAGSVPQPAHQGAARRGREGRQGRAGRRPPRERRQRRGRSSSSATGASRTRSRTASRSASRSRTSPARSSPHDAAAANKLAAQGLVTWINFPSLAPGQGKWDIPACQLDGQYVQLEEAVDVDREVRERVEEDRGQDHRQRHHAPDRARSPSVRASRPRPGRDNVIGILASLGTQATLTALDTPDTRSWETLPARVAVARMRLPPGRHRVVIDARGWQRTQDVVVEKNGWQVVSLMALR